MRGTRFLMRASAVLACLLVAGAVQASVGGSTTGLDTNGIICRNLTTGQRVAVPSAAVMWDCEAMGLVVNPGDQILMGARGIAVPSDAPVSDVVVSVHPTVATMLVVSWSQDVAVAGGWLEFSINGGTLQASPERELGQGPQQELVLGAPADALVDVRIMNRFLSTPVSSADTWTAMTGSLPAGLQEPTLVTYDPVLALPASFLLTSINTQQGGWGLILNREGRIVWYQEPVRGHWMLVPRVGRSGDHLVLDTDTYWTFGGPAEDSTLRRITIADELLETITVLGLHHGWDERSDGTIVWGANASGFDHEELWAVDPAGTSRLVWDSDDWDVPGQVASNTTTWEESSDTVLLAFWTNSGVVEIDFASGEIVRQFGDPPGSWSFDPEESKPWFQHGVNYTAAHTLILSAHLLPGFGNPENEQRIREYALDDLTETLVEIWSYGEGAGIYAPTWGEAFRLDNGNTVMNMGSDPLIREVTSDGTTVWDLEWSGSGTLGHMTFLGDLSDLYALDGR